MSGARAAAGRDEDGPLPYNPESTCRAFTIDGSPLTPGVNLDKLDIASGLRQLTACGYSEPETVMVIEYCLLRHAKGEEAAAERMAIDGTFHGINFVSWRMVLAAAMAGALANPGRGS